jgi:hypothetical protein
LPQRLLPTSFQSSSLGDVMKRLTAAAAALVVSACVSSPGPTANPFSSTTDAIGVALQSGCLPWLVEGGAIYDRLKQANSARKGELNGKPAALLYGNGSVQIQEDKNGGCYLRAVGAMPNTGVEDAARFRQSVLDLIPRIAGPLVVRFDSGPGFNDPVGRYRQEGYCFDLRGRPAWLLVSTSSAVMQRALIQVSVGIDREDICKGKLPTSPAAPAPSEPT